MLGKISADNILKYFSYFSHRRQFAWEFQNLFLGKNKKNITNLLSTEYAHRVLKVKIQLVQSATYS